MTRKRIGQPHRLFGIQWWWQRGLRKVYVHTRKGCWHFGRFHGRWEGGFDAYEPDPPGELEG